MYGLHLLFSFEVVFLLLLQNFSYLRGEENCTHRPVFFSLTVLSCPPEQNETRISLCRNLTPPLSHLCHSSTFRVADDRTVRQSYNERVLRAAREGVRVRVRHQLGVQHGVSGFRRAAGHVLRRIGRRTRGRRARCARERRTGVELYSRWSDDGLRSADTAGGRRRGRPVLARGS